MTAITISRPRPSLFSKQKSYAEIGMRWIAALIVCTCGIAYDQVEIPRSLYITTAYTLTAVYFFLLCIYHSKNYIYLLIPIANFTISNLWAALFGHTLHLEILTFLTVSEVLLLNQSAKRWVYIVFRDYMLICSFLGLACVISVVLDLGIPYTMQEYYSGSGSQWYLNFHVSYIYFQRDNIWLRLCGLYNEPGYFGTMAAFVLILEGMDLRKIRNLIIFCAALCTFSFAFCILIILYLLLSHFNLKNIFGTIIITAGLIITIQTIDFGDGPLGQFIDRFSFENGKVKGDNRVTAKFQDAYDEMFESGEFLVGRGPDAVKELGDTWGNAGLKTHIFKFGVIGFTILWGLILIMALKYAGLFRYSSGRLIILPKTKERNKLIIFIALYFISTYQRSYIVTPDYTCLLFGGIDYIRNQCNSITK